MNRTHIAALLILLFLTMGLTACGGDDDPASGENQNGSGGAAEVAAGDPQHGEELYNQVCIACHGPNGQGVEGLGKPFDTSEYISTHNDAELLAFVKMGRPISDPLNTTGVDMPPKGGNPALSDSDILDIIAYIRTLQE